jgi:hypothetical protein
MVDTARGVLARRPWWGTLIGVPLVALAGATAAWLAAWALGLPLPGWVALLGSAALFTALEIGVRRAGASRAEPARALLLELVQMLGEDGQPRAGWRQGLPYLRCRLDARDVVFSFEAAAGDGLRVAVQVTAEPPAQLWLVGRQPEDFPQRWLDRLSARSVVQPVPAAPDDTVALSVDPEPAAALLQDPSFAREARALVLLNAPTSATFDLQPDGLGWDTLLTPRVEAPTLLRVATRMVALGWAPTPPSAPPAPDRALTAPAE